MAPTIGTPTSERTRALQRAVDDALTMLTGTHSAAVANARGVIATRPSRQWLGLIGVPLAVCAAILSGVSWAVVPLAVGAWWCLPDDPHWGWIAAVGRGVVATEWAAVGANALAAFPSHRITIAVAWIWAAAFLAAAARAGAAS